MKRLLMLIILLTIVGCTGAPKLNGGTTVYKDENVKLKDFQYNSWDKKEEKVEDTTEEIVKEAKEDNITSVVDVEDFAFKNENSSILRLIDRVESNNQKGKFETTEEYNKRIKRNVLDTIENYYIFSSKGTISNCLYEDYNADTEKWTFKIKGNSFIVDSKLVKVGSSEVQNAYGAKWHMKSQILKTKEVSSIKNPMLDITSSNVVDIPIKEARNISDLHVKILFKTTDILIDTHRERVGSTGGKFGDDDKTLHSNKSIKMLPVGYAVVGRVSGKNKVLHSEIMEINDKQREELMVYLGGRW